LSPEDGGRTPAIAVTAFASEEQRRIAINAGFDSWGAKPVDPE
jgi:CheY-like chemotaxis protein